MVLRGKCDGVTKSEESRTIQGMSTRVVIARELEGLPEQDLDKLLRFLRSLKDAGLKAE